MVIEPPEAETGVWSPRSGGDERTMLRDSALDYHLATLAVKRR